MPSLIAALERRLRPLVVEWGFALTDQAEPSTDAALGLLQYRSDRFNGAPLVLDVCQLVGSQSVTVELWSPADVAATTVEAVALYRQVRPYSPTTDPDTLAEGIVGEVAAWLAPDGPLARRR